MCLRRKEKEKTDVLNLDLHIEVLEHARASLYSVFI